MPVTSVSIKGGEIVSTAKDQTIKFCNVYSGKLLKTFKQLAALPTSATYYLDQRIVVSARLYHSIKIWNR